MERLEERCICPNGDVWEIWLVVYDTDQYAPGGKDEVIQYKKNGRSRTPHPPSGQGQPSAARELSRRNGLAQGRATSMSTQQLVGQQLDGRILYERQKRMRENQTHLPGPLVIAAGLQTPENIGSILRLADAAGSPRVIFVNDDTPPQRNRIQRTARNCDALVKWEFWTPTQFLKQGDTLPLLIALELTTDSISIFETELPSSCALVVGGERHGIPAPLLAQCQRAIHIPMYGVNGSMNVTHALAIALFEWRRQHTVLHPFDSLA